MLRCRRRLLLTCLHRVYFLGYAGMKRTIMTGVEGSEGTTEPKRVRDEELSASVTELDPSSEVDSAGELGVVSSGGKAKGKRKERKFDWSL